MVAQFDNVSHIPREHPFLPFVGLNQLELYIVSFTDFNLKIKISTRLYRVVCFILIFKLKSVNDNCTKLYHSN